MIMIKVISTKIRVHYNQGQWYSGDFNTNRKYKSGHGGKKKILHLDHAQSKSYDYQGNYYWIKEEGMLYDKTKGFVDRVYVDKEYKFLVYEGKTGTRTVLAVTKAGNNFRFNKIEPDPHSTYITRRNESICGNHYVGYYQVEII